MEHVYIHIPFCENICSYCDFCKILYNYGDASKYLEALEAEVKEFYMNDVVRTIYVGGGTPSMLSPAELDQLFKIIKNFKQAANCEFTFECNVEDINEVLLDILKRQGVTRLSVGVQSFNPDKLKFMERTAAFEDVKSKCELIRKKGFNNLNLDLMYALPGESFEAFRKDLKLFLKLNPEHLSAYSLIIEDNTKIKIAGAKNIAEETEARMYEYLVKKLKSKGYQHYEISNFAKTGRKSRHNLAYWQNNEYYGFGLGASGYMNGFRYDNTKNMDDYFAGKFRLNESLLSKQEMMEYEVMLGLRKMDGISLQNFFDKYDINLQEAFPVKPLLKSKDLIYKNGYLYINPQRIYLMNEILLKLI